MWKSFEYPATTCPIETLLFPPTRIFAGCGGFCAKTIPADNNRIKMYFILFPIVYENGL
jgi:hypothetical protein